MQRGDRSLRELQYESEQTRAGLTEAVNELRTGVDTVADIKQRISPEAIKPRSQFMCAREASACSKTSRLRSTQCRPSQSAPASPIPCCVWRALFPFPFLWLERALFLQDGSCSRSAIPPQADAGRSRPVPSAALSFSQHETFARLIDWYVAAEPEYGSRL
jgi:hypothetical protein